MFVAINRDCPDVVGWYPCDFTTEDVNVVLLRRSKHGRKCSGAVPHTRVGPLTVVGEDRNKAVTDRVQRKTESAATEKRRIWDRAAKAERKNANARSNGNVPGARESGVRKTVAVRSEQEGSAVVIEDSLESNSEVGAGATPADVSSVQMTSDVRSQRSIGGGGAYQEVEDEVAEVAPGLGRQGPATVAETVAVAAAEQVGDEATLKVEEMMKKLKTENLALHGDLVAEKTAHVCA